MAEEWIKIMNIETGEVCEVPQHLWVSGCEFYWSTKNKRFYKVDGWKEVPEWEDVSHECHITVINGDLVVLHERERVHERNGYKIECKEPYPGHPTIYKKEIIMTRASIFLLTLMLVVSTTSTPLYAESPALAPIPDSQAKPQWGCPWFEVVEEKDYLTMIVDKRTNKFVLTWDVNGDGHWDVQHVYKVVGYGGDGWIPVWSPIPEYVLYDMDYDHKLDLRLFNVNEKGGACGDWISIPFTQRKGPERQHCQDESCNKKKEAVS